MFLAVLKGEVSKCMESRWGVKPIVLPRDENESKGVDVPVFTIVFGDLEHQVSAVVLGGVKSLTISLVWLSLCPSVSQPPESLGSCCLRKP